MRRLFTIGLILYSACLFAQDTEASSSLAERRLSFWFDMGQAGNLVPLFQPEHHYGPNGVSTGFRLERDFMFGYTGGIRLDKKWAIEWQGFMPFSSFGDENELTEFYSTEMDSLYLRSFFALQDPSWMAVGPTYSHHKGKWEFSGGLLFARMRFTYPLLSAVALEEGTNHFTFVRISTPARMVYPILPMIELSRDIKVMEIGLRAQYLTFARKFEFEKVTDTYYSPEVKEQFTSKERVSFSTITLFLRFRFMEGLIDG